MAATILLKLIFGVPSTKIRSLAFMGESPADTCALGNARLPHAQNRGAYLIKTGIENN